MNSIFIIFCCLSVIESASIPFENNDREFSGYTTENENYANKIIGKLKETLSGDISMENTSISETLFFHIGIPSYMVSDALNEIIKIVYRKSDSNDSYYYSGVFTILKSNNSYIRNHEMISNNIENLFFEECGVTEGIKELGGNKYKIETVLINSDSVKEYDDELKNFVLKIKNLSNSASGESELNNDFMAKMNVIPDFFCISDEKISKKEIKNILNFYCRITKDNYLSVLSVFNSCMSGFLVNYEADYNIVKSFLFTKSGVVKNIESDSIFKLSYNNVILYLESKISQIEQESEENLVEEVNDAEKDENTEKEIYTNEFIAAFKKIKQDDWNSFVKILQSNFSNCENKYILIGLNERYKKDMEEYFQDLKYKIESFNKEAFEYMYKDSIELLHKDALESLQKDAKFYELNYIRSKIYTETGRDDLYVSYKENILVDLKAKLEKDISDIYCNVIDDNFLFQYKKGTKSITVINLENKNDTSQDDAIKLYFVLKNVEKNYEWSIEIRKKELKNQINIIGTNIRKILNVDCIKWLECQIKNFLCDSYVLNIQREYEKDSNFWLDYGFVDYSSVFSKNKKFLKPFQGRNTIYKNIMINILKLELEQKKLEFYGDFYLSNVTYTFEKFNFTEESINMINFDERDFVFGFLANKQKNNNSKKLKDWYPVTGLRLECIFQIQDLKSKIVSDWILRIQIEEKFNENEQIKYIDNLMYEKLESFTKKNVIKNKLNLDFYNYLIKNRTMLIPQEIQNQIAAFLYKKEFITGAAQNIIALYVQSKFDENIDGFLSIAKKRNFSGYSNHNEIKNHLKNVLLPDLIKSMHQNYNFDLNQQKGVFMVKINVFNKKSDGNKRNLCVQGKMKKLLQNILK